MIVYDKGQWIEDESMPNEWDYSSKRGMNYQGYDETPNWRLGVEDSFQIEVYWATDERFTTANYRYLVVVNTFAFADGFLVKDFPSLLLLLKEMAPLLQDAREQELYEMQAEEHLWRAKDRRSETREHDFCSHLL